MNMDNHNPKMSVIIPTYNKAFYLDLTLKGFEFQTFRSFEIIIIDDGSSDTTKQVVDKYSKVMDIQYLYQKNKGRAKAKNLGIQYIKGEIVVFNDDDRIPKSTYLEMHYKRLQKKEHSISIGSKYEMFTKWDSKMKMKKADVELLLTKISKEELLDNELELLKYTSRENFEKYLYKLVFTETVDNYSEVFEKYGENLEGFVFGWAIGTTGNVAMERAAIIDKEFDTNFIGWGGEDNEFLYQLYREGYRFIMAPEAINYHQKHYRDKDERSQLITNLEYFMKKYKEIEVALFSRVLEKAIGEFTFVDANNLYLLIEKDLNLKKAFERYV